jgi:signal transduction histidine kinase/CheY-like chemotaxis protein/HPt (histidine-containing phosphotransfer) domain-containing protein
MHSFKFSISGKLILLAVTTSLLTLVCTSAALFLIDQQRLQTSLVTTYATLADTLGYNCAGALIYDQPQAAQQVLSALKKDSEVELAGVFDNAGNCIAQYGRDLHAVPNAKFIRNKQPGFGPDGNLHMLRSITVDNRQVGQIYLQVRQRRLENQRREQQFVMSLVLIGSVIVSTILAWRLQSLISRPVLQLLSAVNRVSASGDYSVRVEHDSDDELGLLSDSFNAMLAQIACRDAELDEHRQHLEDLVLRRTKELEKKTHEAQAASKAKSQFLANMSHEIRTPMNAILGYTELLRRDRHKFGSDEREYVDTVYASGQHLLRLINDVLDLSKIESGRMQVTPEECSPHQIITQVIALMRVPAIDKGLTLDQQWIGPIPATIRTDAEKLRQVLINIIGNAIKFTEQGGIRVLTRLNRATGLLEMEVVDTGIGIPRDQLERIFRPFTQADYSMTRRYSGTGLGLTISRRIAELLGGTLTVESEIGSGSIFKLTIDPGELERVAMLAAPPAVNIFPEPGADSERAMPNLRPLRVLLVEDGDINRRLIHLVLQRHQCAVVDAENGQVGVDLALEREFDVILMDMQMPVKDGYTATSELRSRGVTIPIMALTAHAMSGDEERCLQAGCTCYLTKPINEYRLVQKLAEVTSSALTEPAAAAVEPTPASAVPNAPEVEALHCDLPLDDQEFRSIIEEFAVRMEHRLLEARGFARHKDWHALAQFAHWLKGSGGTVGFHQLTAPASNLERMAKAEAGDQVEQNLRELEQLLGRIQATLNQPADAAV